MSPYAVAVLRLTCGVNSPSLECGRVLTSNCGPVSRWEDVCCLKLGHERHHCICVHVLGPFALKEVSPWISRTLRQPVEMPTRLLPMASKLVLVAEASRQPSG